MQIVFKSTDMNLLMLWKYSLLHLCHVIGNVDEARLKNEWLGGPDETITLEAMINGGAVRNVVLI